MRMRVRVCVCVRVCAVSVLTSLSLLQMCARACVSLSSYSLVRAHVCGFLCLYAWVCGGGGLSLGSSALSPEHARASRLAQTYQHNRSRTHARAHTHLHTALTLSKPTYTHPHRQALSERLSTDTTPTTTTSSSSAHTTPQLSCHHPNHNSQQQGQQPTFATAQHFCTQQPPLTTTVLLDAGVSGEQGVSASTYKCHVEVEGEALCLAVSAQPSPRTTFHPHHHHTLPFAIPTPHGGCAQETPTQHTTAHHHHMGSLVGEHSCMGDVHPDPLLSALGLATSLPTSLSPPFDWRTLVGLDQPHTLPDTPQPSVVGSTFTHPHTAHTVSESAGHSGHTHPTPPFASSPLPLGHNIHHTPTTSRANTKPLSLLLSPTIDVVGGFQREMRAFAMRTMYPDGGDGDEGEGSSDVQHSHADGKTTTALRGCGECAGADNTGLRLESVVSPSSDPTTNNNAHWLGEVFLRKGGRGVCNSGTWGGHNPKPVDHDVMAGISDWTAGAGEAAGLGHPRANCVVRLGGLGEFPAHKEALAGASDFFGYVSVCACVCRYAVYACVMRVCARAFSLHLLACA